MHRWTNKIRSHLWPRRGVSAQPETSRVSVAISLDTNKTLQELENFDWGEFTSDLSFPADCYRLRRKPLSKFTLEELRVMINYSIGLYYLIPIALERLKKDPLVSSGCYRGDLLRAVLIIDVCFWNEQRALWSVVEEIIGEIESPREIIEMGILREAKALRQVLGGG